MARALRTMGGHEKLSTAAYMNRRKFLSLTAGGGALGLAMSSPLMNLAIATTTRPDIKAIAFDAFPIFDPRPIFRLIDTLFPDQGGILGKLWFSKIFGYTWIRTIGAHYEDFYTVIEDSLTFSAKSLKLILTAEKQQLLMHSWLELKVWPDVEAALRLFEKKNIRLAFLSNMTEKMLRINAGNSGIEDMFEFYLSTDRVGAFKPDPRAYRVGIEAFRLPKENIAFAAFAGWDAAGATWFGYPTVWINRLKAPKENLGVEAVQSGENMKTLVDFVIPP